MRLAGRKPEERRVGTLAYAPECKPSIAEAQLALAALNTLPGPGAGSAAQALAAVREAHGLDQRRVARGPPLSP
jgi:hypothetical protein